MKFALLGSPVEHSLSPQLHNFTYRKLGILAEYERFQVAKGGLSAFLEGHQAPEWSGFSLTMPLKDDGLAICNELDSDAVAASSVNTLQWVSSGYKGSNTDVFGFRFLFGQAEERDLLSVQESRIAILGAGGTARAALVALGRISKDVKVYRRSKVRDALLQKANPKVEIFSWDECSDAFAADILINCAPSEAMSSIPDIKIKGFLFESLYSPWPTRLMAMTDKADIFTGKDLLVAQAIKQMELFLGIDLDHQDLFTELRSLI
jgi:shikimate dehydrogenase